MPATEIATATTERTPVYIPDSDSVNKLFEYQCRYMQNMFKNITPVKDARSPRDEHMYNSFQLENIIKEYIYDDSKFEGNYEYYMGMDETTYELLFPVKDTSILLNIPEIENIPKEFFTINELVTLMTQYKQPETVKFAKYLGIDLNIFDFCRTIDDLIPLLMTKKEKIMYFIRKNFKEYIHYVEIPLKQSSEKQKKKHGGHNKINMFLTEEAFELVKNSYNFRNRNIVTISDNVKFVNVVLPIERQTLDFIENTYKDITEMIRQYRIDRYRVDMYFPKYKIVLECDEFGHKDRDEIYEKEREDYLKSVGNTVIRYNPNEYGFDISNILNQINKIMIK